MGKGAGAGEFKPKTGLSVVMNKAHLKDMLAWAKQSNLTSFYMNTDKAPAPGPYRERVIFCGSKILDIAQHSAYFILPVEA